MLITGILQDEGYETCDAGDSDGALELLRQRRPSLVVLDIWLENSALDGMEILSTVKQESPATPVVMISGHGNIETAVNAIKLGAYDFIEKPFKSRSEEHTSELQSLMRISYAVFCLKKKNNTHKLPQQQHTTNI